MRAGESSKLSLQKEIDTLVEQLKKKEEEICEKSASALCSKCQTASETKGVEKEPEPGTDLVRFMTRISELEHLNQEATGRIQRTQVKYRKLFEVSWFWNWEPKYRP